MFTYKEIHSNYQIDISEFMSSRKTQMKQNKIPDDLRQYVCSFYIYTIKFVINN